MSVKTYTDLITSEHNRKPNFVATLTVPVELAVRTQEVFASMIPKFDLDSAEGEQLDFIGVWVGATRRIRTPLTGIFFSWDGSDPGVGWDSGIWRSKENESGTITVLPDDVYRTLIRAKIAANKWDGTIPGAYEVWEAVFPNSNIIIQDNQDMSMAIGVTGLPLDILTQALLTGGYIPLKPEGVRIAYYAVPVDEAPLFSWDVVDNDGLAGWGAGSWAKILQPT